MITYQYTQKDWTTFKEGIKREWAVTNGIGGYAGSSMIGAHSRTHQGYLIASLHAPIERYLVFSKINETVTVGTKTVSFETSQHRASGKTVYAEGQNLFFFHARIPVDQETLVFRRGSFSLPLSMTEACTTPMRQTIFLLKSTSH